LLVLETSRLILREFVPEDLDALEQVVCDAETMQFYPAPFDRSAAEQWIARNCRRYAEYGYGLWAMVLKASGEMIGDCGLTLQTVDVTEETEIGYHLRRDQWGRGLATEAARACRDHGFARLAVDRLVSIIRLENLPSRRVAGRIGMTPWKQVMRAGFSHCVYSVERSQMGYEPQS
jgi:[ribosomal protein S5]-alanine N-acetyltransferase